MGSYYDHCKLCGEEISGRFEPEDEGRAEPAEVARKRLEHRGVCYGERAYAAGVAAERARVVAWLRGDPRAWPVDAVSSTLADEIERGEHEEKGHG